MPDLHTVLSVSRVINGHGPGQLTMQEVQLEIKMIKNLKITTGGLP